MVRRRLRVINRTRDFHDVSLETPELFDDLFLRFVSDTPRHRSRALYWLETPNGSNDQVLTRER